MVRRPIKVGRCRCGGRVDEDGKGCQWHTAVQAQVLREVVSDAKTPLLLGLRTLRTRLRETLEAPRG